MAKRYTLVPITSEEFKLLRSIGMNACASCCFGNGEDFNCIKVKRLAFEAERQEYIPCDTSSYWIDNAIHENPNHG